MRFVCFFPISPPPLLNSILSEYKRWQSIPNRRHSITATMLNHLHKIQSDKDQDSYLPAFFDWLVLGIHTGHRKSEWCQDASDFNKTTTFSKTIKNTPTAIIAADFNLSYKPTSHSSSTSSPKVNTYLVQITWRLQKNGQNDQIVSFAYNYDTPHLYPGRAAERMLARTKRLQFPSQFSLAIYKPQYKKFNYLIFTYPSHILHIFFTPKSKNPYNIKQKSL